jgi:hypothetical protein
MWARGCERAAWTPRPPPLCVSLRSLRQPQYPRPHPRFASANSGFTRILIVSAVYTPRNPLSPLAQSGRLWPVRPREKSSGRPGPVMIRPILCALAFLPAAAPLHGDPLSKFTDLTPAEATRIPQEFALIECFKHPVKRAEVEGGLRIAMISMDRELKDEFIRLGGGECEVKDLVYSTVGVQFKAGNGQENFVVDVRILEVKESLEIWARIRVCSDGQYRVFKTPPDITPAEVERAKRWMDTLRGFLGSTEKLQALTVTNDKFSNPKNAKELYEAAAIGRKSPSRR